MKVKSTIDKQLHWKIINLFDDVHSLIDINGVTRHLYSMPNALQHLALPALVTRVDDDIVSFQYAE
jgi:hypothetical protein